MNMRAKVAVLMLLGVAFTASVSADSTKIDVITVMPVSSIKLPGTEGATTAMAFQFRDGRIVAGGDETCLWSNDGGMSWTPGPAGPGDKVAADLGSGEILSIGRNTKRQPDGLFAVRQKRSTNNWQTATTETATVDIPNSAPTVLGGGNVIDGFVFHHGLLELPDGRLIATMYGNFKGDTVLSDGYPTELGQLKYRTIVVFSADRGRSWANPVLVAYDKMLGRGVPKGHPLAGKIAPGEEVEPFAIVPAVTQEGFREAGLALAPNGDLLCVMRSGGRNGGAAVLFPTPLYCSRSGDLGKTWTPPAQIADRGVNPNLVVLENGIIVCTYSRPGNWLIFSDDNGHTWEGALQFGSTDSYNYLAVAGPDTFVVFHEVKEDDAKVVYASTFSVSSSAVSGSK